MQANVRSSLPETESGAFLSIADTLSEILASQRDALHRLGVSVMAAPRSAAASASLTQCPSTAEQQLNLIQASLAEIASRQLVLSQALTLTLREPKDIALDAYIAASHRISTGLDVAIACAEEVAEIAADAEISKIARQGIQALRLVYHRTNELGALARLAGDAERTPRSHVCCRQLLTQTIDYIRPVATDAGVSFQVAQGKELPAIYCDAALLRETLIYLLVSHIERPGVASIDCEVFTDSADVHFQISDDAPSVTLEQHADALTYTPANETVYRVLPDAAGYAVVRRLARLLDGRIEITAGVARGSQTILTIPCAKESAAD